MPFITQDRRNIIDRDSLAADIDWQPGDMCYWHYKKMVNKWKANPRWTTAHEIYERILEDGDSIPSQHLAWQVFFQLHVMPYELEKRKLNGDIE